MVLKSKELSRITAELLVYDIAQWLYTPYD